MIGCGGCERQHVLDRARGVDRLVFGAGGISCIDGVCSQNVADVRAYVEAAADVARLTARAWACAWRPMRSARRVTPAGYGYGWDGISAGSAGTLACRAARRPPRRDAVRR